MDLESIYDVFAKKLAKRKEILTEDSIRYIFYSCMQGRDSIFDHYVMELPYEMLVKQEIESIQIEKDNGLHSTPSGRLNQELDMLYDDSKGNAICIEIKFHRAGGLHSSYAHTDAAGRIINDIRRLQLIQSRNCEELHRLFVYVTDDEMHDYLSNAQEKCSDYRKRLSKLYQLPKGEVFSFKCKDDDPITFINSAKSSFSRLDAYTITVKKVFIRHCVNSSCKSLHNGEYHVMIYEVLN